MLPTKYKYKPMLWRRATKLCEFQDLPKVIGGNNRGDLPLANPRRVDQRVGSEKAGDRIAPAVSLQSGGDRPPRAFRRRLVEVECEFAQAASPMVSAAQIDRRVVAGKAKTPLEMRRRRPR